MLVSTALLFGSMHLLTPVLPLFALSVGAEPTAVGWLVGAFSASALATRPYAGSASDRLGRRPVFLIGTAVFTVSALLYLAAESIATLLAVRVIQGAGLALFVAGAYALVADIVPPRRRGEGLGLYSLALLLGMAVAPPLAVPLQDSLGFDGLFLIAAVSAAGSFIVALTVEERRQPRRRAGGVGFLGIAKQRWLLIPSLALVSGAVTFGAILSYLPLFTAEREAGNVGVFFSVYAVGTLLTRWPIGRLSDKVGRLQVMVPGLLILFLTMLLLSRLSSQTELVVVALLYSISFGSLLPIVTAMVVDRAPDEVRGVALSVSTASFDLGIGLGSVAFGLVGSAVGYANMYLAAGLVCILGAGQLALWDPRAHRR